MAISTWIRTKGRRREVRAHRQGQTTINQRVHAAFQVHREIERNCCRSAALNSPV